MFEFLFKYPSAVFSKGTFVLLGAWPLWTLFASIFCAAALLGWWIARRARGFHSAVIWLLQSSLAALLLLLLWQPAISIASLKPQQNIVAVVIDDSRSMALADNGASRRDQAARLLNGRLLRDLEARFQVRLYRFGNAAERIKTTGQLSASATATNIGPSLRQVAAESATLPIGAIVLMSDGDDSSGGIDEAAMAELRQRRIPVHAIGFGREQFDRDIELTGIQVPPRTLAGSRLRAQVSLRQRGYAGRKGRLDILQEGKVLSSREIIFAADGVQQVEPVLFNAGPAGVRSIDVAVEPLPGEENTANNRLTAVLNVEGATRRILYVEGEPRWEFKFLRRAVEDDKSLQVVSMLRTTQNKIYRQGIAQPSELEQGFPSKVEDLFAYDGIIVGSVEASYFTALQQEMILQFADRRGGGVLFLGGPASLSDGGYNSGPLAVLLPVTLPNRKATFHRDPAYTQLTPAGRDSLLCRIDENAERNGDLWLNLPFLMNYQEAGVPKAGAVVLAEMEAPGKRILPLLITENYGRGRSAVFATGGSWRWRMLQPAEDTSHATFYRQLLRWLTTDTPSRVVASTPQAIINDSTSVSLRAQVRDTTYLPASDATVVARINGPDGASEAIALHPDPLENGVYAADWNAAKPGAYLAEVTARRGQQELGRDVLTFRRVDGAAENFHREQNRELLEKLAAGTGGRYYRAADANAIPSGIQYSEAGISFRETKDLWDMPAVFFAAFLLRAAEWLLRRKWGAV